MGTQLPPMSQTVYGDNILNALFLLPSSTRLNRGQTFGRAAFEDRTSSKKIVPSATPVGDSSSALCTHAV